MNKSLRARGRESSRKTDYGFQWGDKPPKKEPPFPAALKLITGRRQTEWTGATRCPKEDGTSHRWESLIDRKRTISFSFRLPCRPLAEPLSRGRPAHSGLGQGHSVIFRKMPVKGLIRPPRRRWPAALLAQRGRVLWRSSN